MPENTPGSGPTERLAGDLDATRRVRPPGTDAPTIPVEGGATKAAAPEIPTGIGAYEIRSELGRGGMGVVYRAFDPGLRREVALKVLLVSGRVGHEAIERFHREARAAAKLSHPGIVQIYDVGEADGKPYYTMELLPGRGFDDALRDPGLSPREAVDVVRQVASALHYAHERGVLHRDVKPRNIVVVREENGWTAKVVDFGLAKLVEQELRAGGEGSSPSTLTRTGEVLGTPVYMSPEQVRGVRAVDARSDVYSLGATLYEAISGRVPFDRETLAELFNAIVGEDPAPPRRWTPALDPEVETICLRCLQKDPGHRYPSAGVLAEDCRRWLEGEPISARPVGLLPRAWRRARRNKAVAIPLGLMGLLLAAVLGAWVGGAIQAKWRFRDHIAAAERALSAGKLEEALDEARGAAAIGPEDKRARRALADIAFAQGRLLSTEYEEHSRKERMARLEAPASDQQAGLASREARWKRDADIERSETLRGATWSQAVVKFHEGLMHDPDHAPSRSALAELYWDELVRAEQARDAAGVGRYKPLVERYGGEDMRQRLRGDKDVRIVFLLPDGFASHAVEAFLYRYEQAGTPPILAPVPFDRVRMTPVGSPALDTWEPAPATSLAGAVRSTSAFPLRRTKENGLSLEVSDDPRPEATLSGRLPRGSYLLYIPPGQGVFETRYPFEVSRDEDSMESCELVGEGDGPPVPPGISAKGSDENAVARFFWAYVPAGWVRVGGDPDALRVQGRPEDRRRIPPQGPQGFFVARLEFLAGAYTHYLSDRSWHELKVAMRHVPRTTPDIEKGEPYMGYDDKGQFTFASTEWGPLWAVVGVSLSDADDLCRWLTERHGRGEWEFGLPTEDEWEMTARGADGRHFPWGDTFDPSFCRMAKSRSQEEESSEPVGRFPVDESPYGVLDLAGGVREWTATPQTAHEGMSFVKGGGWYSLEVLCRSAIRSGIQGWHVSDDIGFRVVARRKK